MSRKDIAELTFVVTKKFSVAEVKVFHLVSRMPVLLESIANTLRTEAVQYEFLIVFMNFIYFLKGYTNEEHLRSGFSYQNVRAAERRGNDFFLFHELFFSDIYLSIIHCLCSAVHFHKRDLHLHPKMRFQSLIMCLRFLEKNVQRLPHKCSYKCINSVRRSKYFVHAPGFFFLFLALHV